MTRTPSTPAPLRQIKPAGLRIFHTGLAKWYAVNGRHDLPWRTTRDPYEIWVSEVMLQQTQVATVRERFYFPFLKKFPTVQSLATAPRESVMKAWEGLGYYRRAGYLHEAAKKAVTSGMWQVAGEKANSPVTGHPSLDTLLSLPGIGRNTAHAILAFAHHQPVAILEANVKRVVARIFALRHPSEAELWKGAENLLNKGNAFDYNQAMMDLGSAICTPKNPRCEECPANVICEGKKSPENYPAPKIKKQIPTRRVAILVERDAAGKLYLERRGDALLGGLWGFPQSSSKEISAAKTRRAGLPRFARNDAEFIGTVTHIYSHFRLEGDIYLRQLNTKKTGKNWHTRDEIAALPLSKLDHKVLTAMDARNTMQANATTARKPPRRA